MNFFSGIANNEIFISDGLGWLIEQFIKTIILSALTKYFVADSMVGRYEITCSHSFTVCTLDNFLCILYFIFSF